MKPQPKVGASKRGHRGFLRVLKKRFFVSLRMTNTLPVMLNPSLVVILKEQKRLKNLRTGSVKHLFFFDTNERT